MELRKTATATATATRRNNRSMSDAESQFGSFRSALQFESPLHSDENTPAAKGASPVAVSSRSEVVAARLTKVAGGHDHDAGGLEEVVVGGVGGERRSATMRREVNQHDQVVRRRVKRAELGLRVCEVILCLISFSVMATDKTRGWSGDSFDRYKEYRYCAAVSLIGFVYSGLQAFHLAYDFITHNNNNNNNNNKQAGAARHHLRCLFDFTIDQILAYLLVSASSSAATRVEDWVSNWGKDVFAEMASASVGMSFLAFAAFALSSLISGCHLCRLSTATTTA